MQARLSFLALLFSALFLLASPAFSAGGSAPSREGVSPRCEAAIDKAAGSYSQCLLKASAKFAKKGNKDRLLAQQTRCGDQYNAQIARAQDRFGEDQCTAYTSQIADRTLTYAEEVSIEAGGEAAASRLYVQDAAGGTLTETTLLLSGTDESTLWFTDRPYRDTGQIRTADFVALFSEQGANSFAENPPNADFTCESGGEVVNQAVTLTDPILDQTAGTLSYTAEILPTVGEGDSFTGISCDGSAHLFIDDAEDRRNLGMELLGYSRACEAAGGNWDSDTSQCIGLYNCFTGGFCSELALLGVYPAARGNLYDGARPDTFPASQAGCNEAEGAIGWASGKRVAQLKDSRNQLGPLCGCTHNPYDDPGLLYPCASH